MDQEVDSAAATHFARSRTAAGPVLELKSGDALELAFIVGDESEPRGFGVSSNPEIVASEPLAANLQRRANLTVGSALAVSYTGELARWNIETTIVVPGAFTSGTNHFAHSGSPEDKARLEEYESGPTANLGKQVMKDFALTAPADADASEVAKAIVNVVDMPFGTRPFRVHIDPAHDGAEIVNDVADRVRAELLRNMKLADLLRPSST